MPVDALVAQLPALVGVLLGAVSTIVATGVSDRLRWKRSLSFRWDGRTLLLATASASPTARNLMATGKVRLGLGETRDVVLIEGMVEAFPATEISPEEGDAFAVKTDFDPRTLRDPYHYFRVFPRRIQAWREVNELADRVLMTGGRWVVAALAD